MIERRSILKCLVGLVAAPAIIKVSSLMPVNAGLMPGEEIARLMRNYVLGEGVAQLDVLYDKLRIYEKKWAVAEEQWDGAKIGDMPRIRLPDGYITLNELRIADVDRIDTRYIPSLRYNKERRSIDHVLPQAVGPLVLAAAAVAVAPAVLERPVTRRFWSK